MGVSASKYLGALDPLPCVRTLADPLPPKPPLFPLCTLPILGAICVCRPPKDPLGSLLSRSLEVIDSDTVRLGTYDFY